MRGLPVAALLVAVAAVLAAPGAAKTEPAWYAVEPDLRKCVSPLCGGWWVREVNRSTTRCLDGSRKPACYVAELGSAGAYTTDERLAQAGDAAVLLARGYFLSAATPGFPDLSRLAVTRAYARVGTAAQREAVYRVRPTRLACVTSPCFTIRAARLNEPAASVAASELDLSSLPAPQRSLARTAYANGDLVAGGRLVRVPDAGPAGDGRAFVAGVVYRRLVGA